MRPIRVLLAPLDGAYGAVLLLLAFSGVYLTRLMFSPVYGTTFLGIGLAACVAMAARVRAPLASWAEMFTISLVLLPVAAYQASKQVGAPAIGNMMIGPLLAAFVPVIGQSLTREHLIRILRAFILITLLVATGESAWRVSHPDWGVIDEAAQHRDDVDDILFYAYKFNSVMYLDSNFVGLQLVILFAFLFAVRRDDLRVPLYWKIWTFMLIVLTFSRASIITSVAILLLSLIAWGRGWIRAVIAAGFAAVLVAVFSLVRSDASFATKFDILNRFLNYLQQADVTSLFLGVGISRAVDVLGIGGHNFVVVYVTELGLVVFCLWLAYWLWMLRFEPRLLLVMAAWFINGFSLSAVAAGYLFASGALLRLLALRRQQRGRLQDSPISPIGHPMPHLP